MKRVSKEKIHNDRRCLGMTSIRDVAKLAGVPDIVINRAKEIARELEEHDLTSGAKDIMPYGEAQQLSFFRESDEPTMEHPFMAELREKDLSDMTPLEALNYLYVLQEKLKNEE